MILLYSYWFPVQSINKWFRNFVYNWDGFDYCNRYCKEYNITVFYSCSNIPVKEKILQIILSSDFVMFKKWFGN